MEHWYDPHKCPKAPQSPETRILKIGPLTVAVAGLPPRLALAEERLSVLGHVAFACCYVAQVLVDSCWVSVGDNSVEPWGPLGKQNKHTDRQTNASESDTQLSRTANAVFTAVVFWSTAQLS